MLVVGGVASAQGRVTTQQQHETKAERQNAGWNAKAELTYRDTGRIPVHRAPSAPRVRMTAPTAPSNVINRSVRRTIVRLRRFRGRARTPSLLASLGDHFRGGVGDRVVSAAKARSKARQALLDRTEAGLSGRIRAVGFDSDRVGHAKLTGASYVRMGAVDELFRKIDAMIMGGLTHNDLRIENVRVTTDGTLVLVGWKRARLGGSPEADLRGQQRLRKEIERVLYH